MKKSRFTEHQIIVILEEADASIRVREICLTHGISKGTYNMIDDKPFSKFLQ